MFDLWPGTSIRCGGGHKKVRERERERETAGLHLEGNRRFSNKEDGRASQPMEKAVVQTGERNICISEIARVVGTWGLSGYGMR